MARLLKRIEVEQCLSSASWCYPPCRPDQSSFTSRFLRTHDDCLIILFQIYPVFLESCYLLLPDHAPHLLKQVWYMIIYWFQVVLNNCCGCSSSLQAAYAKWGSYCLQLEWEKTSSTGLPLNVYRTRVLKKDVAKRNCLGKRQLRGYRWKHFYSFLLLLSHIHIQ